MSASKLVIDREAAVGSLPRPLRYRGLESACLEYFETVKKKLATFLKPKLS